MPTIDYIVSDIHLGAVPESTERQFLRFLEHVGREAASLLIAGDLFDFWFEYGEFIHGKHFRVLAGIAALVEAGIPVTYVGGNHDAWGGRFLREEMGVEFRTGRVRMELGGRPALVAHGDGLGGGDLRYRLLKSVLRSGAVVGAFRALHPEVGLRIARRVSRTETKVGHDAQGEGRARFLLGWARQELESDGSLRLVVCGHAHLPALEEVDAGRFYVNTGDWIRHFTYATVSPGAPPVLQTWGVAAPA